MPWLLRNGGLEGTRCLLPTVTMSPCFSRLVHLLTAIPTVLASCRASYNLDCLLGRFICCVFLFLSGDRMGLLPFRTSGIVSARDNPKFVRSLITEPLLFTLPWYLSPPNTLGIPSQLGTQRSLFPVLGQSSQLSLGLKPPCQV